MTVDDPKVARLRSIGVSLYGKSGWQSRLARDLDLSPAHMSAIVNGVRRLTPTVETRLLRALVDTILPDVDDKIRIAREIAGQIFAELGIVHGPESSVVDESMSSRQIEIPDFSVILLAGPSGAGKSSFAAKHFAPDEILSSDAFRAMVAGSETVLDANDDAFELMREVADRRLKRRLRVVIDATNVRPEDRRGWVAFAKERDALVGLIALRTSVDVCSARNASRPGRDFGDHVIRRQASAFKDGLKGLKREGFHFTALLDGPDEIDAATVKFVPLVTDKRFDQGPFDIVGDVHGCASEFEALLAKLGYALAWTGDGPARRATIGHPEGRRVILVGDLVDRGPNSVDVVRIAMAVAAAGGYVVPGNHDDKLKRHLAGRQVKISDSLQGTLDQFEAHGDPRFGRDVERFLDALPSHVWLDGGRVVVAHAGIKERMIGRASRDIREFCLYGEATGETDDEGYPVRADWAARYKGEVSVVYGHTVVPDAQWVNNTICIDTGCVFGGSLTALRWPERELASVAAESEHCPPRSSLGDLRGGRTAQALADDDLDITRFLGRRGIETARMARVTIGEAQSAAAIEVATRFGVDPRWMIYLPSTMSPAETSKVPGVLEHPAEAFRHYARAGVGQVTLETKHMGSRGVVVVCRDRETAQRRFGVTDGSVGQVYSRSGRPMFADEAWLVGVLAEFQASMSAAGLWAEMASDWIALDCEIMPWSLKAGALIRDQFERAGDAAYAALYGRLSAFSEIAVSVPEAAVTADAAATRLDGVEKYRTALARYARPCASIADVSIAPFRALACENRLLLGAPTSFHHDVIDRLAVESGRISITGGSGLIVPTAHVHVALGDAESEALGVAWWAARVADGAEGVVVKPSRGMPAGDRQIQPGLKVRGHDYLRLVYGPEYDVGDNLAVVARRSVGLKRSLALREYALGEEGLLRFVAGRPLAEIHECALGVLALESEAVDPTL